MALIKCKECGKEVSSNALACPDCGAKVKKPSSKAGLGCVVLLAAVILFAIIAYLISDTDAPAVKEPPTYTSAPKRTISQTKLNAKVAYDGSQFQITNNDSFNWRNVKLEVNGSLIRGGYILKAALVEAGQTYRVGVRQFAKSDGTRLNPVNIKVQKLDIFCDLAGSRRGYWFGEWK